MSQDINAQLLAACRAFKNAGYGNITNSYFKVKAAYHLTEAEQQPKHSRRSINDSFYHLFHRVASVAINRRVCVDASCPLVEYRLLSPMGIGATGVWR